ncbi:MAG: hypothetical protein MJ158_03315 [Alphaproteobacteria bacterium]|nr:hypothetical protein [Alphaproteobacteria bacterium]
MKKNLTYFLLAATALAPSCSKSVDNGCKENNGKMDTVRVIGAVPTDDGKYLKVVDKNSNEYIIDVCQKCNSIDSVCDERLKAAFFAERGDTLMVEHKSTKYNPNRVAVVKNLTMNRLKQEYVRQR